MSLVPYVAASSLASGSTPVFTLVSRLTGYWLGRSCSGAKVAVEFGLYAALAGWSALVGMMFFSNDAQAVLNRVQSWVAWPYSASSRTQKLNASEVVRCP